MIDTHNHLLYGLDDGATGKEMALEMAGAYINGGVRQVVTTTHIRSGMFNNTEAAIQGRAEVFRSDLSEANLDLEIVPSAEYYYDDTFLAKLDNPKQLLTFGPSPRRYILLEFNGLTRPLTLRDTLFALKLHGITPIMAHPERYAFVDQHFDWIREMVDAGLVMQGTLACLAGLWDSRSADLIEKLLDADLIHIIATDAHSPNDVRALLDKGLQVLKGKVGADRAETLAHGNPTRILAGQPLSTN